MGYFGEENTFSASWEQLNGIKYEMGFLVITSIVREDIRLFLKIEWIVNIIINGALEVKMCSLSQLMKKTRSYECSMTEHISFQVLAAQCSVSHLF